MSHFVELVIIDESERLSATAIEHLRDQYDRGDHGLLFIGMTGIEKTFSRYPQLYSRVGFAHHYRPLTGEELSFVLNRHWHQLGLDLNPDDFTDAQAIAAVHTKEERKRRKEAKAANAAPRLLQLQLHHRPPVRDEPSYAWQ